MVQPDHSSAIVLFSGGQDSTVCLAWSLARFEHVETIGFNYGQRHSAELSVRQNIRHSVSESFPQWGERLGVDHLVDLGVMSAIAKSALLDDTPFGVRDDGLPSTFVPGRNVMFLTVAGIVAKQRGLKVLVTGTCETDFSGYPDCRDDTIKALQVTLNLALEARLAIETPLMWIDKAATWELAAKLGGPQLVNIIVEHSHTCYANDREHRHPWGYGCAACDACALRARGWERYIADQLAASVTS